MADEEHHRPPLDAVRSLPSLVLDSNERLARLETLAQWILDGQQRAEDSRARMHKTLAELGHVAVTVARIEPLVMAHEALRLRADGARLLGDWLSRVMWAVIGGAIYAVIEIAHYFTGKH